MTDDLLHIERPERWDIPFGADMTDAEADEVLKVPPFAELDPDKFPHPRALWRILRYDARIVRGKAGDVIVRCGDDGNSAFFILAGSVRVEVDEPPEHRLSQRQGLWPTLSRLWRHPRAPEVRDKQELNHPPVGIHDKNGGTRLVLQDLPAVLDHHRTARLGAGEMFGELAALGRTPRTARVVADGDVRLLEIRWQGLRDIMRCDDAVKKHVEKIFRERALSEFLRSIPLFSHLDDDSFAMLVASAQLESFGQYDTAGSFKELATSQADAATRLENEPIIAEEGHYPNGVIMIRSGLTRVSERFNHGHRTVSYLLPGQTFGFDEIAQNYRSQTTQPLRYTLRALGYVNVVTVPTAVLEQYVLAERKPRRRSLPLAPAGSPRASGRSKKSGVDIPTEMLEFLVERRFINGTATMVIDLNRCTRCDDCVRACASTHDNNPRFLRHGPVHGHHMVANACMHCLDPLCMIECPTGAIHRESIGGLVVIDEQTCIGCSACARNCPYDAIRMVEIRDRKGRFVLDPATNQPVAKATKCDLCGDQHGGPACQRACPHDALMRVDMRDPEALADWLHR